MEVQATPLAPDIEYYFDCAYEQDEICGATHAALKIFGDRKAIAAIIDAEAPFGWRPRMAKNVQLDQMAFDLMIKAPAELRDGFVALGLLSGYSHAVSLAEVYAWWNFEDSTIGGALEPYRDNIRCDRLGEPTPRAKRRLYSPRAIRRFTKQKVHTDSAPFQKIRADRLRSMPWPAHRDAASQLTRLYDVQREAALRRIRMEANNRAFFASLNDKKPKAERNSRRPLIRAALFAASLLGAVTVNNFIQGQPVLLEGQQITLEVRRGASLDRIGHGSLNIAVLDRDGIELCKLCFYIEGTPTLDQLAALAMFVEAGAEEEIFTTGNMFAITPAGFAHELLAQRSEVKAFQQIEQVRDRLPLRTGHIDRSAHREAMQRYEKETSHLYAEALLNAVWGRDGMRLRRWATA